MAAASNQLSRFIPRFTLTTVDTSSQKRKSLGYGGGHFSLMMCPNTCTLREKRSDTKNKSFSMGRRHILLSTFIPLSIETNKNLSDMNQLKNTVQEFGFDGLGSKSEEYAAAKVIALAQAGEGAVLFLGMDGYKEPLQMTVGPAEAMAVLTAAQERFSARPVTHEAWGLSLDAVGWKVDRMLITSLEQNIFYSRVVLTPKHVANMKMLPSITSDRSVDMRPSDGIALALRCHAPIFICKDVAEQVIRKLQQKSAPELIPNHPNLQAAQWMLPPVDCTRIVAW